MSGGSAFVAGIVAGVVLQSVFERHNAALKLSEADHKLPDHRPVIRLSLLSVASQTVEHAADDRRVTARNSRDLLETLGQYFHDSSSRVSAQVSPASDAVQETLVDSSPIVDASYPQASPVGVSSGGAA